MWTLSCGMIYAMIRWSRPKQDVRCGRAIAALRTEMTAKEEEGAHFSKYRKKKERPDLPG